MSPDRTADVGVITTRPSPRRLGINGEEAAERCLQKKRYRIVARNFRFHRGEIDLIAYDRSGTLVFFEVKTRRGLGHGSPEESVTLRKQHQIRKIAGAYLAVRNLQDVPCRFDIISISLEEKDGFVIRHIENAF